MLKSIFLLVLLTVSGNAISHPGRVDSGGGHTDRKSGQYHCHKEPCYSNHKQTKAATSAAEVENRAFSTLYNRKDWPHWVDTDRDCQNTRAEALINASTTPVKFKRNKGCNVSHGTWFDPYTNATFTQASKLDIDHIIPLKEAHISGGDSWTRKQRRTFANDYENLIVVSGAENKSKGAKDPAKWLPETRGFQCEYVKRWLYVKHKYSLSSDLKETVAINKVLNNCE